MRKRSAKTILSVLTCLSLGQWSHAERDARLSHATGKVSIISADGTATIVDPKDVPLPLQVGETVATDAPGSATIQLDAENTVELDAKSRLEIKDLDSAWTKLSLPFGRIFAKIEEKLRAKDRRMNVITRTAVLAVRGTEFAVEASDDDADPGGLGVFEGKVETEFTALGVTTPVEVSADQEVVFARSGPLPRPRAIERFALARQRMVMLRKRHSKLRKAWKQLSSRRRNQIRQRMRSRRQGRR
ncbi:MAG: FecR family protein [Elusimicrobiota bacterium]